MLRVPVMKDQAFAFGAPVAIARPLTNNAGSAERPCDLAPDGKHFVGAQDITVDPLQRDTINIVVTGSANFNRRSAAS